MTYDWEFDAQSCFAVAQSMICEAKDKYADHEFDKLYLAVKRLYSMVQNYEAINRELKIMNDMLSAANAKLKEQNESKCRKAGEESD